MTRIAVRFSLNAGVALLAMSVVGCEGQLIVGDPGIEVTRLRLAADDLGALRADECVVQHGEQRCARYPNPLACDELRLSIKGDGSTSGECHKAGQAPLKVTRVTEGVPIACRVNFDSWCVQCVDIYGKPAVDSCGDGGKVTTFSQEGMFPGADEAPAAAPPAPAGDDVADQAPDAPAPNAPAPDGAGLAACDPQRARLLYAEKLNQLLQAEGLKISFVPPVAARDQGSFFGGLAFASKPEEACDAGTDVPMLQNRTDCDGAAKAQGRCYCEEDDAGFVPVTCRCARFGSASLLGACAEIPVECDRGQWSAAIWSAYGAATSWLQGSGLSPTALFGGAKKVSDVQNPAEIICKGSPLVLDLAGDGIALGSLADGVRFDLGGRGQARPTAWVRGADDALLAIDRDGNGRIDSGAELFGEAPGLDGALPRDGFAALAAVDRPSLGGNGNGLVEAGDLLYEQLLLWRDADGDGVSQPAELQRLAETNVAALEIAASRDAGSQTDTHGNDLSLRAGYLRSDGSRGALVDVYFVAGR